MQPLGKKSRTSGNGLPQNCSWRDRSELDWITTSFNHPALHWTHSSRTASSRVSGISLLQSFHQWVVPISAAEYHLVLTIIRLGIQYYTIQSGVKRFPTLRYFHSWRWKFYFTSWASCIGLWNHLLVVKAHLNTIKLSRLHSCICELWWGCVFLYVVEVMKYCNLMEGIMTNRALQGYCQKSNLLPEFLLATLT